MVSNNNILYYVFFGNKVFYYKMYTKLSLLYNPKPCCTGTQHTKTSLLPPNILHNKANLKYSCPKLSNIINLCRHGCLHKNNTYVVCKSIFNGAMSWFKHFKNLSIKNILCRQTCLHKKGLYVDISLRVGLNKVSEGVFFDYNVDSFGG